MSAMAVRDVALLHGGLILSKKILRMVVCCRILLFLSSVS